MKLNSSEKNTDKTNTFNFMIVTTNVQKLNEFQPCRILQLGHKVLCRESVVYLQDCIGDWAQNL